MNRNLAVSLLALAACHPHTTEPVRADRPPSTALAAALSPAAASAPPRPEAPPIEAVPSAPAEPVHVEGFAAEDAYVVRGSHATSVAILFGGVCAHPQGYVEAIQFAAAAHVQLVGFQGDAPCSGVYKGWSFDIAALSRRIDRTFAALGFGEPKDVLVIGYSQGAVVAERLAQREPAKFTRFVLMASPIVPTPSHFAKAAAVASMAGTRDKQSDMKEGALLLEKSGVRSRYFALPGATHGQMGDDPEGTFEKVFAWLDEGR